jgi:hypothetical protein
MSASAPAADLCPSCGHGLPRGARFCPDCGASVEDPVERTMPVEVPPAETGPVPVSFSQAEPRWFGLTPPVFLLAVAGGCFVLALALFASGHWPFGLILLGIAALLLASFLELVRRRPRTAGLWPRADVRARAESTWETWRARLALSSEVHGLQGRLEAVGRERQAALLELGAAVHGADPAGEAAARTRLAELDALVADLRRRLEERVELADERIRQARLPVQETLMVTPNEPSQPYPPPDEGTPPTPAVVPEPGTATVPEPYPPPDEGTPPEPARTPEPQPGGDLE